jgi:hypothetical protein
MESKPESNVQENVEGVAPEETKEEEFYEMDFDQCRVHKHKICSFCVNSNCRKPLCYLCIYEGKEHADHFNDCLPLPLVKIENAEEINVEAMAKKVEEAKSYVENLSEYMKNYISNRIETLAKLKEHTQTNKIDFADIFDSFLSEKWKHTMKDGIYTVAAADMTLMLMDLNSCNLKGMGEKVKEDLEKQKVTADRHYAPLQKTNNRFGSTKNHWLNSSSYWDGIGFKISEESLILMGFGVFKPDNATEFTIKVKIFDGEMEENKVIFEQDFDISKLNYVSDVADVTFDKEVLIRSDRTYIIAKFNNKNNPNSRYGKEQTTSSTTPFEFVSVKGTTSNTYKSGNFTDLNNGAFPHFLYKSQ